MSLTGLLEEIVEGLESSHIPYMVSGSLAQSIYATPRMTRDLDIVIELSPARIADFAKLFQTNFYFPLQVVEEEVRRKGMFNVIDHRSGYKVDFVIRKVTPYREMEFRRRRRERVLGILCWVVTPEDLIISKLAWIQDVQSELQLGDIKDLLERPDLDRAYLKYWLKELDLKTFSQKV